MRQEFRSTRELFESLIEIDFVLDELCKKQLHSAITCEQADYDDLQKLLKDT